MAAASGEAAGPHTFNEGQTVWVPDNEEGYALAKFVSSAGDADVIVEDGMGKDKKMKRGLVFPTNPDSMAGVPDNTTLMFLHDPHLLDNIRYRYLQNKIYTYTAHILIVVNPYRLFPELYSTETLLKYKGRPIGTLPPHVFAVADRAYRSMVVEKQSQGVIVSGESGAGKTETAKHVMSFLATIGGMEGGMGKLERRILDANPILEAFGNAKTLRNNNSSRFGKFTKINFDARGKIVGASIDTYLLEKSRLLFQAEGERNYHIFYQLVQGLPAAERARLGIGAPEDFHYINQGGDSTIDGVDDAADFERVLAAMSTIGIPPEQRQAIVELLAGLLHLGNIAFEETEDEAAQVTDLDVLERAAMLMRVDIMKLRTGLLCRSISAGADENFEVPLTAHQAKVSRDSLASVIYSRLFNFMVDRINAGLRLDDDPDGVASKAKKGEELFIGVLDIYGFEVFESNSFEQLTINYANEKVHQYFIKATFKEEQEIYKFEAIPCPEIKYQDNQDALNMLEDRRRGVFAMIDDEQKKPKASDINLLANLHTAHRSKTQRWIKPEKSNQKAMTLGGIKLDGARSESKKMTAKEGFVFRHFAGEVCYKIAGFVEKNTQNISVDAELVLTTSTHPLFPDLFPDLLSKASSSTTRSRKRVGSKAKTVSSQFLTQLGTLMDVLNSTTPNFIRCVKPNAAQAPGIFEGGLCLDQMRCSGMLEVLELMQVGYPTRCPYSYLHNMYVQQMPEAIRHLPENMFCEAILMALELDPKEYALGVTRVFFRAGQLAFLEQLTGRDMSEGGIDLVAKVKRWLVRKRWQKALSVTKTCVRLMHLNEGWRNFKRLRSAASTMVLINRGLIRPARALRQRNATIALQCSLRAAVAKARVRTLTAAAIQAQATWRMLSERGPHVKELQAVRMRKRIEEELRQKEAKKKRVEMKRQNLSNGMLDGGSVGDAGIDPYALGGRAARRRAAKIERARAVQDEDSPSSEAATAASTAVAGAAAAELAALKEQVATMTAAVSSSLPAAGGLRRVSAGATSFSVSPETSSRLAAIEGHVARLPSMDHALAKLIAAAEGRDLTSVQPPPAPVVSAARSRVVATVDTTTAAVTPPPPERDAGGAATAAVVVPPEAATTSDAAVGGSSAGDAKEAVTPADVVVTGKEGTRQGAGDAVAVESLLPHGGSQVEIQLRALNDMMVQTLAMGDQQSVMLKTMVAAAAAADESKDEELRSLHAKNRELEEMLIKARVEIEVKESEANGHLEATKRLKQDLVDARSERQALIADLDKAKAEGARASADAAATNKELKDKKYENTELREKVHDLAEQLVQLKRSVKELIQIRSRNQKRSGAAGSGAGGGGAGTGTPKDFLARRTSAASSAAMSSIGSAGRRPSSMSRLTPSARKLSAARISASRSPGSGDVSMASGSLRVSTANVNRDTNTIRDSSPTARSQAIAPAPRPPLSPKTD